MARAIWARLMRSRVTSRDDASPRVKRRSRQGHPLLGGPKAQKGCSDPTTHLPAGRGEIPARGFGKVLGLRRAVLAFTEGLDNEVDYRADGDGESAGRDGTGDRVGAEDGTKIESGIRALMSRDHTRLRGCEPSVRNIEIGVVVKRGERERSEVPRRLWSRLALWRQRGDHEALQAGVVERAALESSSVLGR